MDVQKGIAELISFQTVQLRESNVTSMTNESIGDLSKVVSRVLTQVNNFLEMACKLKDGLFKILIVGNIGGKNTKIF